MLPHTCWARTDEPAKLRWLEKIKADRLDPVQILDALADMENLLNWTRSFGPLSGHEAKIDKPRERYVVATFCYGCNLGPSQTARSLKDSDWRQIAWVNQRHITEENLDQEKEIMLSLEASSPTPFDDGELYDTLLGGFDYGLDFYVDLAQRAMGPVLDLGCGTGRILLPCMRAGVDIDGLDLFEPMLAQLRQSAAKLGLSPRLYRADMSDFRTQRRYALIMIPFNAFTHNLTQDRQIQCLGCCREHLLPDGMLVFDGAFPGLQWIGGQDGIRLLEGETTDPRSGRKLRVFDTRSFDRVQQLQHSITEVESVGPDGTIEVVQRSEYDTRWVYREEMALLLRHAGYARWEISGDFDGRPLTQETDGMVVRAWTGS